MAVYTAADDAEDDEEPDTGKEVEPASTTLDPAAAAVAKIIDTSRIYGDLFRQLQAGPAFQAAKWLQDQDLLGTRKLLADVHKGMFPSSLTGYAAGLRSMDQLAGRERLKYLKATAALSESAVGPGTLSAWRTSLQVESVVSQIIKGPVFKVPTPPAWATEEFRKNLGLTVHRQVYMTDWLAGIDSGRGLLSEISSRPLSLYRDYVGNLGDSPTRFELGSSLHTGLGVNGLLGADALSSETVLGDADLEEEVADRVDDLLSPQQAGRLDVLEDLRKALTSIDTKVVEMLEGGWHVVRQAPPAAAEMAAQCAVESIDRAIRAAAPDNEVENWLPTSGRPEKEWRSSTGRLTRAVRIRYIMRGHKDEAKMTCTLVDNIIALQTQATQRAQAIKHASAGDLSMARCLLGTAEHILTVLFVLERD
ncbi:hypothetical protein [Streptomyces sp. NBC_01637]|uniref:pPIWI-associating nuclease domain-containing protein n=1 Tax=unclassified Streptomyces TaxID=2593676 RepID=UPI00386FA48F|nr:hypothetical protein OH719_07930 [Streptomyces sp. NBC_01653]WTD37647.1 hypothetical protein OHB03_38680 [Streptomyces sp. NBC_01643]WTD93053.1 hypothetical protein OG891_38940 [Streptomyces sp. NBC_01637]